MKRISCNTDNVGGLTTIVAIPLASFNRIKEVFSTGQKYVSVASTADVIELPVLNDGSFSFEEVQSAENGGDTYDVTIQGVVPRSDTDPELRRELERGEWLVLHQDGNGACRLSGTVDVPLRFSSHRASGNTPVSVNGNAFTFSAQEPSPSVEVEEEIIVE